MGAGTQHPERHPNPHADGLTPGQHIRPRAIRHRHPNAQRRVALPATAPAGRAGARAAVPGRGRWRLRSRLALVKDSTQVCQEAARERLDFFYVPGHEERNRPRVGSPGSCPVGNTRQAPRNTPASSCLTCPHPFGESLHICNHPPRHTQGSRRRVLVSKTSPREPGKRGLARLHPKAEPLRITSRASSSEKA